MRVPESVDAGLDRDGPGRGAIRCGIRHVSRLVVAKKSVACWDRVAEMGWPTRWPRQFGALPGVVTYVCPSGRSHITVPSDWWDGPEIRNKDDQGSESPTNPRQGCTSKVNTPVATHGSSFMIAIVSSTVAMNALTPKTSEPSSTVNDAASTPASSSPKLRRPCSIMSAGDVSSPEFGPGLRMTRL